MARTKRRPTDEVEIRFRGPTKGRDSVVRVVESLGFVEISDAPPWRSVLPKPASSGQALKGARTKKGFPQAALAEQVGIPQRHITEIDNGKRPVDRRMREFCLKR